MKETKIEWSDFVKLANEIVLILQLERDFFFTPREAAVEINARRKQLGFKPLNEENLAIDIKQRHNRPRIPDAPPHDYGPTPSGWRGR